jgi:hypothetical protein
MLSALLMFPVRVRVTSIISSVVRSAPKGKKKNLKMTTFWDITPCSLLQVDQLLRGAYCLIALMMGAISTSETSVNYQTTRRNIPEGCHLHIRRRENLKSHKKPHVQRVFEPGFTWYENQNLSQSDNQLDARLNT